MAQFDVHLNPRGGRYPLLLDCQAGMLGRLATRVVVPLVPLKRYGGTPITRLNPIVKVGKTRYVAVFQELAAVPNSALGAVAASLDRHRGDFVAAIDLLLTGI